MNDTDSWDAYFGSLFEAQEIKNCRDALASREAWFVHQTELAALESIRRVGLQPRLIDGISPPAELLSAKLAAEVLCMTPWPSPTSVLVGKDGALVMVAVAADDLPPRISLDWTFPDSIELAKRTWLENKSIKPGDLVSRIARNTGSLACYDTIRPELLRIRLVKTDPRDPSAWPYLLHATEADLWVLPANVDVFTVDPHG